MWLKGKCFALVGGWDTHVSNVVGKPRLNLCFSGQRKYVLHSLVSRYVFLESKAVKVPVVVEH